MICFQPFLRGVPIALMIFSSWLLSFCQTCGTGKFIGKVLIHEIWLCCYMRSDCVCVAHVGVLCAGTCPVESSVWWRCTGHLSRSPRWHVACWQWSLRWWVSSVSVQPLAQLFRNAIYCSVCPYNTVSSSSGFAVKHFSTFYIAIYKPCQFLCVFWHTSIGCVLPAYGVAYTFVNWSLDIVHVAVHWCCLQPTWQSCSHRRSCGSAATWLHSGTSPVLPSEILASVVCVRLPWSSLSLLRC